MFLNLSCVSLSRLSQISHCSNAHTARIHANILSRVVCHPCSHKHTIHTLSPSVILSSRFVVYIIVVIGLFVCLYKNGDEVLTLVCGQVKHCLESLLFSRLSESLRGGTCWVASDVIPTWAVHPLGHGHWWQGALTSGHNAISLRRSSCSDADFPLYPFFWGGGGGGLTISSTNQHLRGMKLWVEHTQCDCLPKT